MKDNFSQKQKACGLGCLLIIPLLFVLALFMKWGESYYGEVSGITTSLITLIILAAIGYLLRHKDGQYESAKQLAQEKNEKLKAIASKYNALTSQLRTQYSAEVKGLRSNARETVRKNYEHQYNVNKGHFEQEKKAFLDEWNSTHTQSPQQKKMWQWGICAGFIILLGACSFTMGATMEPQEEPSRMTALMESRSWNADNIPMPHMTNGDLYVSNPDSILSEEVVDSINIILKQLDENLNVESAFVIVGHIEGDEPVNMVRDIYKKYKVGREDRGLVVVVGYLDHSYFIAPGRSLEADMTDLECNHLAQDYLIPSMKAEKPDSGMLYLARGAYALLAQKEMPRMSALTSGNKENQEDQEFTTFFGFFLLLLGWGVFASKQASKLGWMRGTGSYLSANPFTEYTSSGGSGGSSYGSSGGRSWGGGSSHSSGGYGGGSWGGGGSGGRW